MNWRDFLVWACRGRFMWRLRPTVLKLKGHTDSFSVNMLEAKKKKKKLGTKAECGTKLDM